MLEPRLLLANVAINEVMAVNVTGLQDEDGDRPDWIELRNTTATPQSLNGFHLTDDPLDLNKWVFPDVTVPANGYLIVFASDKDRAVAGSQLHTNFNLDRNGETLLLVRPDGETIETQLTFGEQEEDISFGPDPGTTGNPLRKYAQPSPGAANVRSEIVINEIHYDPDVKIERVEFIELYNPSPIPVSLSNAFFSAGIDFIFQPGASIAPGQYLVLAENTAHFRSKFGAEPFGQYTGSLDNDGETITLRNVAGGALERVDYGAGFPWPTVGEAPGRSIQLINPDFDNDLGGNWRSAAPTGASSSGYTQIFPSGSSWRYRKGTSEASSPTSAWRQLGFVEDGSWSTGNGPFGVDQTLPMGTTLADMPRTASNPAGYISVFLRKTFTINDPNQFAALRAEVLYDDGFNLWINGTRVAGRNVSAAELPYNQGCGCTNREDFSYVPIDLPNLASYLRAGTNVIAAQFHNTTIDHIDAFFDARLMALPTVPAGARNSVFASNAAPAMRQVEHSPNQPTSNTPVTITAKITDPQGVASATLQYQLVDPGSYIAITDPAYATSWTNLPMRDDGTNGDVTAGDGIYTAVMPANLQVHRRLIRYRITSTDTLGASITGPYADDEQPNFAYYVYNGVPSWTGAVVPGSTPNVTYSTQLMNSLPVYQLISKQTDVENSTWYSKYGGEDYLWKGTLVYDGVIYDHVSYRARGGVWRYSMGKNMWKFDFNRNHGFQAKDDYGIPYQTKWDKLNLSAIIQQGNFWHRGEQGLFESVGFKLFNLAGVAGPKTNYAQFRIVDEASEIGDPSDQYDDDLWGLYLALEQQDGNLLDEHGLPDGNLYKMEAGTGAGGGVSNNQGPTQPADNSDLVAFSGGIPSQTEQWYRDNVNLQSYFSYQAIVQGIHHYDIADGKNYFYYHNPETNKWEVLPWDLDLTWSDNMYRAGVDGGGDPLRNRVIGAPRSAPTFPALNLEYQNRLREIRDLLFNADQTGAIIDEMAAKVYTPGQPSWVDIDRMMWDYNPTMIDPAKVPVGNDKAGQGRFYAGGGGISIPPPGGFAGMIQKLKDYVAYRSNYIDTVLLTDTLIPNKPTLTYSGPALFPIDGLTFNSSNFSDSTGTFAAMKWRIGRVTNPAAPGYNPKAPKFYEMDATWESEEITTFANGIMIPPQAVEVGGWYRVRVKHKDSTGRWSRWSDAVQFLAGPSPSKVKDFLRVTEINYNPDSPPPESPFPENDDYEFIEIKNTGNSVINLLDANFSIGIEYTFGDISLAAGESLVLAKNPAAFATRYDTTGMKVVGGYLGLLDNGGEELILEDALGQKILTFIYDDIWQPTTDGSGYTLQIKNPNANPNSWGDPASWRAGLYINGTPGADEVTLPQGSIVINEVLTNSDVGGDWIELYNNSAAPINIGGWYLSDMPSQPAKYRIAPGTTVGVGEYIVFTESGHFNNPADPGALTLFSLNDSGDDAVLTSANGFGVVAGYDHEIHFDAADPQVTLARYTTSGGSAFAAASTPTQGGPNSAPKVGPITINEIMYNPPLGGDEFLELHNVSTSAVNLFDPAIPANTWKFTRGITFSFPQGVTMAAGAYLILTNIDPATFRSKYNIPAAVQIFQYVGSLDNAGESLILAKPAPPEIDLTVPYVEIDRVDYDDIAPWPTAADGGGSSIGKLAPTMYGNDPPSWEPEAGGGTPGALHNDTNPPIADIVDVSPDPRTSGINSIIINFTEPVINFDLSDLRLVRGSGANLLSPTQTLTTTNNTQWTLGNLSGITWIEGTYTLSFSSSSNVTDQTGHGLATPPTDSFAVTASTLTPGNGNNTYTLRLNGSDLDIFENGDTPTYRVPLADFNALHINGGSGNDAFTIDFSGGNPIPAGGLFINGSTHGLSDTLTIVGHDSTNNTTVRPHVIHRPSGTTAGNGTMTLGGRNFTFTGIEPLAFRNLSSLTFVTPNATDQVTMDSPSAGQTRFFGNSSGITFFATSVFTTPLMVLDAAANDGPSGNDTITIGNSGSNTSTTTMLRVQSGAGNDTFNINGGNNFIDLPPGTGNLNLNVNGVATANLTGSPRLGTLTLNTTARVNMVAGGANTLRANALNLATATVKLDLNDNDMIVQSSSPANRDAAFTNITNWVRSGRNAASGRWTGNGIISTSAASNPQRHTTIAAMINDTGSGTIIGTLNGHAVNTNSIILKYTYTGDMNFNGVVDADDYARIDAGYNGALSGYRNGDLDYSGLIDADDYWEIDRTYSTQGAPLVGVDSGVGMAPAAGGAIAEPPIAAPTASAPPISEPPEAEPSESDTALAKKASKRVKHHRRRKVLRHAQPKTRPALRSTVSFAAQLLHGRSIS